ncbi:MAG: hypothetical protein C5B60_00115 [Chloroflexi bacterium]|nr:MAG: hypothetical protein C5B60_00115 [Chloroflexota bacterium]
MPVTDMPVMKPVRLVNTGSQTTPWLQNVSANPQTPWLQNVDANNFALSNASQISVNGCVRLGPGPLAVCASANGLILLLNGVPFATIV